MSAEDRQSSSVVHDTVASPSMSVARNATPTTPRTTLPAQSQNDDPFESKTLFVKYLNDHLGCGSAMAEINAGQYTKENRKCITGVAASKLIDVYGCLPSSHLKLRVGGWLGEITSIESTAFFDPKTHRGYLNKALENRRRKNPDEKRWTWSKRARVANLNVSTPENTPTGSTTVHSENCVEIDGCPRNIPECELCGGEYLSLTLYS